MPLVVLGALVVAILLAIALTPVALVQRYRRGTDTHRARGWVTILNLVAVGVSAATLLLAAAVTTLWVPSALALTAAGFGAGCVLGIAGLALTRWEPAGALLHYTPNRWLVLGIMVVVSARIAYGFWRSWAAWRAASDQLAWIVASGAAGSMAAGALVLGYYLIYWIGVRRRLKRLPR